MRFRTACLAACLVALVALPAAAQAIVPNPATVEFNHDGYATAQSYQVAYHFLAVTAQGTCGALTTASPTAAYTDTVPKPTTTTGTDMTANLVTRPIGCYVLKVRVLDASGLYSVWSVASTNAGQRDPTAATNVLVK